MQVKLSQELEQALREIARRRSISVESLIEQAIRQLVAQEAESYQQRVQKALSVVGKYRFGITDLAENHDTYFAEAVKTCCDERLR
ncbi:MAG: CopG family transcriptional regulator [Armatimonadota bacterium]